MMKCVFTTNDKSQTTYPLLKAALLSLLANTRKTLEPVVVWGGERNEMTEWLDEHKIEIKFHELSFKNELANFSFDKVDWWQLNLEKMYKHYPKYYNANFIETESMRIDIPKLFPREQVVMYADCDVIFLSTIPEYSFSTPLMASVRKGINFNNGIMFMNIPKCLETYDDFLRYYLQKLYTYDSNNTTTQGAYNDFYQNRVTNLGLEYNWFPFWGINPKAKIIHFAGPKPLQYEDMLAGNQVSYDPMYVGCSTNEDSIRYYLNKWHEYDNQKA